MAQGAERRIESRETCEDRLFAQITACGRSDLIGTTFSCRASDASSSGLCLTSDVQIPAGAKLDLWIENSSRPGKYFLTSDVRWVETLTEGGCAIGVELQENPTTDINQWRQCH